MMSTNQLLALFWAMLFGMVTSIAYMVYCHNCAYNTKIQAIYRYEYRMIFRDGSVKTYQIDEQVVNP